MTIFLCAEWREGFFKSFHHVDLRPTSSGRRFKKRHLFKLRGRALVVKNLDNSTLCGEFEKHVQSFLINLNFGAGKR